MAGESPVLNYSGSRPGEAAGVQPARRHARGTPRRREAIAGYLFLLPNLAGFVVFSLVPIVAAFGLTLTDWSLAKPPRFVGLQNFGAVATDPLFWKTAGNSVYYAIGAVPVGVFLAFWLALLLNRKMRGIVFFRTVFFLPHVTLVVAIAIVWQWLYHPQVGLFNYLLSFLGVRGPNWLGNTHWAMPALIIMSNWMGIGYAMLVFLAGLQGIPDEYYEAAKIDGATALDRVRHITVPLISPVTFFVLVTSFIGAMQGFDQFYIMTQGGPAFATTTVVMYIFQNGFSFFKMGYAATIAVLLFVAIFVITIVQWRLARTWVYGFDS